MILEVLAKDLISLMKPMEALNVVCSQLISLKQKRQEPKSYIFVTVVHKSRHKEIHTLDIPTRKIVEIEN